MNFREFWEAYDDLVKRALNNKLTMEDHSGTTVSLKPRWYWYRSLCTTPVQGQAAIIGVALTYRQNLKASQKVLSDLAVSKTMTVTSTYDHRVIQGAGSGEFHVPSTTCCWATTDFMMKSSSIYGFLMCQFVGHRMSKLIRRMRSVKPPAFSS